MILGRLELDEDQRALYARIQNCVDQATAADPWLAGYAEVALAELSEALARGPSDFDVMHWRRFFSGVLAITRRLAAMPITPRQQLAVAHLVHLVDENRDLIDT